METEGDLRDDRESPERSHEQFGDVKAGDVLDHLAAAPADSPVRKDEARADHEITRCAETGSQRSACCGGEHAADGRSLTVGWVEHQTLAESRRRGERFLHK